MELRTIEKWEEQKGRHYSVGLGGTDDVVYSVSAVKPTWRDVWSIIRGTYKPEVQVLAHITLAGTNKVLKSFYNTEIKESLNQPSIFLEGLDGRSRVNPR